MPKIIHIIINDFDEVEDITKTDFYKLGKQFIDKHLEAWKKEVFQRNSILKGLKNCKDDDVIIIGDLDEIPNKKTFNQLKNLDTIKAFEQKSYYYYLNCQGDISINCCRAVLKKSLTTPQDIRFSPNFETIKNGGWHFSYLGGIEKIKEKINSFSHQEFNTKEINNLKNIKYNIENNLDALNRPFIYKTVKIDNTFPIYIQKNIAKYKKFIKNNKKQSYNTKWLINEIINNRKEIENLKNKQCEYEQQLSQIHNDKLYKFCQKIKNKIYSKP